MRNSVLAKEVTMNKRVEKPNKLQKVVLLDVLQSDRYKQLAEQCSRIPDKTARQSYKKNNVPAITPSGIFAGGRKAVNLIQHSGLICLDLDGVEDVSILKKKVSKLSFVAYCGMSISGTGLFAIIHIPESTADEHKNRYAALERLFIKKFGITGAVDPQPKSVAAPRFVSYDPEPYFNHNATKYTGIDRQEPLRTKSKKNYHYSPIPWDKNDSDLERVHEMVQKITEISLDFCPDYDSYIRVAFSLANLREQGRELFHSVCQYSPKYDHRNADVKFTDALKNGSGRVSLGAFFGMCDDYGLMQKKRESWKIFRPPPLKKSIGSDNKDKVPLTTQSNDYPASWDEEQNDPKECDLSETDQVVQNQPNESIVDEQPTDFLFAMPNKVVQRTKTIIRDSALPLAIDAYTNHQNELLIHNPIDANRFTLYPDIDSYNHRSVKPKSRHKNTVDMTELTPVMIDTEKLIVIHPIEISIG